ncbi:MAG: hypothetical protein M3454_04135 [Actinomycetota bacterium]|nr:hypothetical protein [Actinomycetota bacterium]
MIRARSVIAALCASATVLACGPGTLVPAAEPPRAAGSRADIEQTDLLLGTQLAALRGHNLVAVELVKRRQSTEALLVLDRGRNYAHFLQNFAEKDAESPFNPEINRAIDAATAALKRGDGSGTVTEALVTAGRATLRIESEIVGKTSELAAYKASVVSTLADHAGLEYDLAISADPFDLGGYRLAYGLLREAKNIHGGLTNVLEQNTNDEARAAEIMFAAMFGAMPSSDTPSELRRPFEVPAVAYVLGEVLADEFGSITPPPRNRLAFVAPVLEEALGAYESGEAGVADVLVQKVRASQSSAGEPVEAELDRLSAAIRGGAADSDIATLVEESSELAADAAAGE